MSFPAFLMTITISSYSHHFDCHDKSISLFSSPSFILFMLFYLLVFLPNLPGSLRTPFRIFELFFCSQRIIIVSRCCDLLCDLQLNSKCLMLASFAPLCGKFIRAHYGNSSGGSYSIKDEKNIYEIVALNSLVFLCYIFVRQLESDQHLVIFAIRNKPRRIFV